MTKAEVANEIANKTGLDKADALVCLEGFMAVVKDSLVNGEPVYLRGFGSFIIKKRATKSARDILKNTTITVPEHNIPAFKAAKSFAAAVRNKK
ncbi:MAG: integration host factor subunit beta [Bacteroidaceae bacterium]|nr:integration host factor subunit beta [Bacteroidaceae bacterium]